MATVSGPCGECGTIIVVEFRNVALDKPKRGPSASMIQRVERYGTFLEQCEHCRTEAGIASMPVGGEVVRFPTAGRPE